MWFCHRELVLHEWWMFSSVCSMVPVRSGLWSEKFLQSAEVHLASYNVLSKDFVGEYNGHFLHLIKTDGILSEEDWMMKQIKNSFNSGCNHMFYSIFIVINVNMMGCVEREVRWQEDSCVYAVIFCWRKVSGLPKKLLHWSLFWYMWCFEWRDSLLKRWELGVSAMSWVISQQAGLKSEPNVRPHWK